jgi:fluoride exporter
MQNLISVLIGGMLGTGARYLTSIFASQYFKSPFPVATILVNIVGCFLIGILMVLSKETAYLRAHVQLMFVVGFCGAFTTFSTFIYDASSLIQDGDFFWAFLYMMLNVVVGFFMFYFGTLIGKMV